MINEYFIGSGNYFGSNSPNGIFNRVYVPRLVELGIKPENMKEVAEMFGEIYQRGLANGEDIAKSEWEEND